MFLGFCYHDVPYICILLGYQFLYFQAHTQANMIHTLAEEGHINSSLRTSKSLLVLKYSRSRRKVVGIKCQQVKMLYPESMNN